MTRWRNFLPLVVCGLAIMALSASAYADPITIGLQEDGTAITPVSSADGAATFSGPFGTWVLSQTQATGSPFSPEPNLTSGTIDATFTGSGCGLVGNCALNVYVTEQDVTSIPQIGFLSGFTSNILPMGWTVTETTYFNPDNALFGTEEGLNTATFSQIGTASSIDFPALVNTPYSLTEVFTITPSNVISVTDNTTADTIKISNAVPESSSLPLLAVGLSLIGFAIWRHEVAVGQ